MVSNIFLSVAASMLLASAVQAICPGYNFGITETGSDPALNANTWQVFDDSCNVVDTVITNNPCTVGVFDCSPAPITFTGLNFNGLSYACRPDVNSGSCNGHAIQVCCRNDGN